jgi:hypothetical protein
MKFISLLFLFFGFSAQAVDYADAALEIGFRQQNGTFESVGVDENAKIGYQVGMSGSMPIADSLSFRSGLFYVEKAIEIESGITKTDLKFTYFQIPVALMFKFIENAGVYGGVNIDFNLSDDCGSDNCDDVQSLMTPIVIGAAFKFAPQMGANLFFESGSGKVANNVKDFKAVGVNLMITFD